MVRSLVGKHPNYYEAILQLRDVTQKVVTFVEEELHRTKMRASKIVEIKNGLDYYLIDNDQARALGKRLQQQFGGEYLVTATLHTKIDDKEKYRLTILFREAPFKKGEKVIYKGEECEIRNMSKEILLVSKKGKKIHLRYKEMNSLKPLSS